MSKILDNFNQPEVEILVDELRFRLKEMKHHAVFTKLKTIDDLRLFMSYHVFAVWDFMSLAKRLQFEYTTFQRPWIPPKNNKSARHINEIILGEETDEDGQGGHCSHYELYLRSMQEVGASTEQINDFVDKISKSISVNDALTLVDAKTEIQKFIKTNMKTAMVGKVEQVLGSFIFGREDSIPEMFQSLLDSWGLNEENAPCFVFYLKRHIQLDTDVHAPAAFDMLQNELNGDIDRLQVTLISAIEAVNARIGLWDAIEKELDSIG